MMVRELFYFLVFPGFLFGAAVGGFLSWMDRKITARVQFRQGPPVLQPLYDVVKLLFVKEVILPKNGSVVTFLAAPVFGLFGATIASVFILLPLFNLDTGFRGDIIVIFYLLVIPSLTYIVGAMASGNPLAAIGASREIKLIIAYELTFLLIIAAVIYRSAGSIGLNEMILVQQESGAFIQSVSGILLFIALLFVVQAKLGLVPFDMAEAETEIAHGLFIENSGAVLGIVKLTKYILLLALPAFVVAVLLGGFNFSGINILWSVLKLFAVLLLITLVRNTNPRLKIKQAMRFFFVWMNMLVIVAIILSYFGL
jgi:NADH-quinone oxidoreductase subunit H